MKYILILLLLTGCTYKNQVYEPDPYAYNPYYRYLYGYNNWGGGRYQSHSPGYYKYYGGGNHHSPGYYNYYGGGNRHSFGYNNYYGGHRGHHR